LGEGSLAVYIPPEISYQSWKSGHGILINHKELPCAVPHAAWKATASWTQILIVLQCLYYSHVVQWMAKPFQLVIFGTLEIAIYVNHISSLFSRVPEVPASCSYFAETEIWRQQTLKFESSG
jgi:hypothetical protein